MITKLRSCMRRLCCPKKGCKLDVPPFIQQIYTVVGAYPFRQCVLFSILVIMYYSEMAITGVATYNLFTLQYSVYARVAVLFILLSLVAEVAIGIVPGSRMLPQSVVAARFDSRNAIQAMRATMKEASEKAKKKEKRRKQKAKEARRRGIEPSSSSSSSGSDSSGDSASSGDDAAPRGRVQLPIDENDPLATSWLAQVKRGERQAPKREAPVEKPSKQSEEAGGLSKKVGAAAKKKPKSAAKPSSVTFGGFAMPSDSPVAQPRTLKAKLPPLTSPLSPNATAMVTNTPQTATRPLTLKGQDASGRSSSGDETDSDADDRPTPGVDTTIAVGGSTPEEPIIAPREPCDESTASVGCLVAMRCHPLIACGCFLFQYGRYQVMNPMLYKGARGVFMATTLLRTLPMAVVLLSLQMIHEAPAMPHAEAVAAGLQPQFPRGFAPTTATYPPGYDTLAPQTSWLLVAAALALTFVCENELREKHILQHIRRLPHSHHLGFLRLLYIPFALCEALLYVYVRAVLLVSLGLAWGGALVATEVVCRVAVMWSFGSFHQGSWWVRLKLTMIHAVYSPVYPHLFYKLRFPLAIGFTGLTAAMFAGAVMCINLPSTSWLSPVVHVAIMNTPILPRPLAGFSDGTINGIIVLFVFTMIYQVGIILITTQQSPVTDTSVPSFNTHRSLGSSRLGTARSGGSSARKPKSARKKKAKAEPKPSKRKNKEGTSSKTSGKLKAGKEKNKSSKDSSKEKSGSRRRRPRNKEGNVATDAGGAEANPVSTPGQLPHLTVDTSVADGVHVF